MIKNIVYPLIFIFTFLIMQKAVCQIDVSLYVGLEKVGYQNLALQPIDTVNFSPVIGANFSKSLSSNLNLEYGLMYTTNKHRFSNGDIPGSSDFQLRSRFISNNISLNYSIVKQVLVGGGISFRYSFSGEKVNTVTGVKDNDVQDYLATGFLSYIDLIHNRVGLRLYYIFRLDNSLSEGRNPEFFYGISIGYKFGIN